MTTLLEQAKSLPAVGRVQLMDGIWASLVEEGYAPDLTPEQAAELDRRLAEHEANPQDIVSWEAMEVEVSARYGRY